MKKLLIVFHSKTGGTYQMAQAAASGAASEPEVQINLIHAGEAGPDELLQADGYIFATPENLAMMSGMMKDFFDRTYYPVLDRIVGRPYATLICAGSDGENAARQIQRIVTGWRLKAIAEPVIVCTYAQTPGRDPRAQRNRRLRSSALRRDRRHPRSRLVPRHLLENRVVSFRGRLGGMWSRPGSHFGRPSLQPGAANRRRHFVRGSLARDSVAVRMSRFSLFSM